MNQFAASGPVQFDGAAVTVLGARVVGLSASAALLARGASVTLIDRNDDERWVERDLREPVGGEGVALVACPGGHGVEPVRKETQRLCFDSVVHHCLPNILHVAGREGRPAR